MSAQDDDLMAEEVPGYVVGEKKTIDEYTKLDAEDESLAKWKASLGLSDNSNLLPVTAGDARKVVILEMALLFPDEPSKIIVVNLEDPATIATLSKNPFKIPERSIYQLRIRFRIQHEIVTGLKYLQGVKKAGIRVDKVDEPCGSFAPNTTDKPYYEKLLPETEAPSGMLARGSYSALSKFVDDDHTVHLSLPWSIQITKQ